MRHGIDVTLPVVIHNGQGNLTLDLVGFLNGPSFALVDISGINELAQVFARFIGRSAIVSGDVNGAFWQETRFNETLQSLAGNNAFSVRGIDRLFGQSFASGKEEIVNHVDDVFGKQNPVALVVNDLALLCQDVIVIFEVFANIEVFAFDLFLSIRDRVRQHFVYIRIIGKALLEHLSDVIWSETTHKFIIE